MTRCASIICRHCYKSPQDRSTAAYDNCCTVLPVVLSAAAEFNNSDTQLIVTDDVFEQSEIKSHWPQTIAYAFKRRPQLLLWRSQFLVLGFFILSYSTFRCGHAFKVAEHVQTANWTVGRCRQSVWQFSRSVHR
jgi:hypothetical protein